MRTELLRVLPDVVVLRADDDGADESSPIGVLHGHAARFNEWTEIDNWWEGHFLERIGSGAFDKTLSESLGSIRCLFRHGRDPQIGDKVLGAFRALRADADGLYYEVPLYDTSYNRDLAPGLADGQYGASFRASVIKHEVNEDPGRSDHNPEGLPEVTLTELRLRELGPCTFGAYTNATAAMRSMFDDPQLADLAADPERFRRLADHVDQIRTRLGTGAADGTPVDGRAASSSDDEPARSHSTVHPDHTRLKLDRFLAGI